MIKTYENLYSSSNEKIDNACLAVFCVSNALAIPPVAMQGWLSTDSLPILLSESLLGREEIWQILLVE